MNSWEPLPDLWAATFGPERAGVEQADGVAPNARIFLILQFERWHVPIGSRQTIIHHPRIPCIIIIWSSNSRLSHKPRVWGPCWGRRVSAKHWDAATPFARHQRLAWGQGLTLSSGQQFCSPESTAGRHGSQGAARSLMRSWGSSLHVLRCEVRALTLKEDMNRLLNRYE